MRNGMNETELRLLAHLHERSAGSGQRVSLDPKAIAGKLRLKLDEVAACAAALAAHGLAGLRGFRPVADESPPTGISAVWLTGKGEDYLRQVEADVGVGRRITVALVEEMGGPLRAIAGFVLAEFTAREKGGPGPVRGGSRS